MLILDLYIYILRREVAELLWRIVVIFFNLFSSSHCLTTVNASLSSWFLDVTHRDGIKLHVVLTYKKEHYSELARLLSFVTL